MITKSIGYQSGIARSEQWRMRWACRTAISIACVAFICLYPPAKKFVTRNGKHNAGPPFAGLVIGMAKDRTFGGTLINCWSLTLSCFITCFSCWIIIVIVDKTTSGTYDVPDYVLICIIFVLVLIMQCLDLPPLAKKFMCSIVPLLIISIQAKIPPADVWYFQVDTIVASGCALVGNIIPLPIEFSSVDLQKRTSYVAYSSTALLVDLFKAWQYQSCINDVRDHSRYAELKPPRMLAKDVHFLGKKRMKSLRSVGIKHKHTHKHNKHNQEQAHTGLAHRIVQRLRPVDDTKSDDTGDLVLPPQQHHIANSQPENKHWRKLRLTLICAIQFKLNRGHGLGWYFTNHSCGSKFLRAKLVGYLREGINDMVARNVESKFASLSPLRRYLFGKYAQFSTLLKEILTIVSILEDKITFMEDRPEQNYIYRAFHNIPKFRHGLDMYFHALCTAIESISDCLTHSDREGVHPTQQVNFYAQDSVVAIAALLNVRQQFDTVYYECRQSIYYEHIDCPTRTAYRTETPQDTQSLPLLPDVLLNMNSFLFLADALCNQIQAFWSPTELVEIEARLDARTSAQEGSNSHDYLEGPCWYWWLWPTQSMSASARSVCLRSTSLIALCQTAALDLFPSQTTAFRGFFPRATPAQTQASLVRLKSAFSVALSMSIASVYGVYLHRTQAFLAAFTIAFLAGGSAAGVTMVTSLNRAAGTVVACVVAIVTQFLLVSAGVGVNTTTGSEPPMAQQVVIGIVVVLFQIPATIVRSYPLQGYAGTCVSFTICIILLAPNLDSTAAIDRIIDTFVGVVIYLVVEALLATTYTENILLGNMKAVFEGIDARFAGFQKNFFLFKNYARSVARNQRHAIRRAEGTTAEPSFSAPCLPLYSLNGLHMEPIDTRIKAQADLMRFLELEPGLRGPPPMPVGLVEECVALQTQAVKHLQVMYWAIKSCADAGTDPAVAHHQKLYRSIRRKLLVAMRAVETSSTVNEEGEEETSVTRQIIHHISTIVSGSGSIAVAPAPPLAHAAHTGPWQAGKGSDPARPVSVFQFAPRSPSRSTVVPTPERFCGLSEPTVGNVVPIGAAEGTPERRGDGLSVEKDACNDNGRSGEGKRIGNVFHFIPPESVPPDAPTSNTRHFPTAILGDTQKVHHAHMKTKEDTNDSDDASSSSEMGSGTSQGSFDSLPPTTTKKSKFMLLTLEKSFLKVGRYISLVCTFLQMSLHDLAQWQEASAAHVRTYKPTGNSLRNVNTLNETRVSAHTEFLLRSASLDAFSKTDAHLC